MHASSPSPVVDLPAHADVVVVGGGLAGLTAAAMAAGQGRRVVLLEGHRLGGRGRSDSVGAFTFNQGPHAVYDHGPARRTYDALGLRLAGGPPSTKLALLGPDGVRRIPSGPAGMLASRWLTARQKVALGGFLRRLGDIEAAPADVSMAQWLDGQGLTGNARRLAQVLARTATYQADLSALSADAGVVQMRLGLSGVTYLDGGWQSLVDSLAGVATARGAAIVASAEVQSVEDTPGGWRAVTPQGAVAAPAVILAAGGPATAARLLGRDPGWGDQGPAVTAACSDLGLRRVPDHPLVLGSPEPLYLSVHCPPARLAPPGHVVAHLLRYGATTAGEDRSALDAVAVAAGVAPADVVERRFLARMVVAHAAPHPARGGLAGRPPAAVADRPGLAVAGDWVGPEGLLADASVASAAAAVRAVTSPRATMGAA